jgi:hypothetical protein
MRYAVEMGSVSMLYVPSFINIRSGIQKLTCMPRVGFEPMIAVFERAKTARPP